MVAVDLANAEHPVAMPGAGSDDAIVVAVMRDGTVFLGPDNVDPAELGSRIRANRTDRAGETMYLRADAARSIVTLRTPSKPCAARVQKKWDC